MIEHQDILVEARNLLGRSIGTMPTGQHSDLCRLVESACKRPEVAG